MNRRTISQIFSKEFINYLIVGGLTTLISLIIYYSLVLTILNPKISIQLQTANVISWIVSVSFAYLTNRKFVFHSKNENIVLESIGFFVSRLSTLLIDMLLMFIIVTHCGFNDKIAKIVVQIIVIVSNYILSKFFVFKR